MCCWTTSSPSETSRAVMHDLITCIELKFHKFALIMPGTCNDTFNHRTSIVVALDTVMHPILVHADSLMVSDYNNNKSHLGRLDSMKWKSVTIHEIIQRVVCGSMFHYFNAIIHDTAISKRHCPYSNARIQCQLIRTNPLFAEHTSTVHQS